MLEMHKNESFMNDVEERQQKLQEKDQQIAKLSEELAQYKRAAKGASDGLWDWDIEKDQLFVSHPYKVMLGIEALEVSDMRALWADRLHPDDQEVVMNELQAFINGEVENYKQEFRLRHADESYKWIFSKAQAVRNDQGIAIRASGAHTDITERKLMTNALEKSEAKYRNLFQNSLVAIYRCKADTYEIIEANDKFWQLFKKGDKQSILGHKIFSSSRERETVFDKLHAKGFVDNVELEVRSSTDAPVWVSFSAVLYPDDNIIECILKDISQTKENLLELQKVNFELDSFVYHASHDLRSPLRSILGLIDLYRMESDVRIKDDCVERIESSVKRLDDLVMELLSISRNDRVNDPHVDVNFMVEINNSISSYYNASNTKGLQIRTKVVQKVPFKTDLTRVRIILNNIISNAIKYRSFHKDLAYVNIEASIDSEKAVLKIEDNGEGIEASKLPHIFDMFYRATERSEGSGLGLYIVKKVADKLGAKIQVDSVELEGTTFTVTIPNSLKS